MIGLGSLALYGGERGGSLSLLGRRFSPLHLLGSLLLFQLGLAIADFIAVLLIEVFDRTRWFLSLPGFVTGFDFFDQPFDRTDHDKYNQQDDVAVDFGHGMKN